MRRVWYHLSVDISLAVDLPSAATTMLAIQQDSFVSFKRAVMFRQIQTGGNSVPFSRAELAAVFSALLTGLSCLPWSV